MKQTIFVIDNDLKTVKEISHLGLVPPYRSIDLKEETAECLVSVPQQKIIEFF